MLLKVAVDSSAPCCALFGGLGELASNLAVRAALTANGSRFGQGDVDASGGHANLGRRVQGGEFSWGDRDASARLLPRQSCAVMWSVTSAFSAVTVRTTTMTWAAITLSVSTRLMARW